MLEGNYQTTVLYEVPGKEAIAKIELGYRTGPLEETFLPYYIFYILLPQDSNVEMAAGLNMYGVYYVPAIEGKYIENMPVFLTYKKELADFGYQVGKISMKAQTVEFVKE